MTMKFISAILIDIVCLFILLGTVFDIKNHLIGVDKMDTTSYIVSWVLSITCFVTLIMVWF